MVLTWKAVLRWKNCVAAIGLAGLVGAVIPAPASAISVDLARSCKLLTTKQFPPREPTNPAAGSAKGSGRDQQAYFNKCVANKGKVDDDSSK
jgi:hypothetical protein